MIERLTRRELEILDLAAQHLTSKQIGPRLGIRPGSVDTFMQAIIRKLEVSGRKQAIIVYLADREAGVSRGDLDFGSPAVEEVGGLSSPLSVAWRDQKEAAADSDPQVRDRREPTSATGTTVGPQAAPAVPVTRRLGVHSFLATAPRRLVAIAVVALVLGFVTFGAIAAGYGLTQVFDRAFREHARHP